MIPKDYQFQLYSWGKELETALGISRHLDQDEKDEFQKDLDLLYEALADDNYTIQDCYLMATDIHQAFEGSRSTEARVKNKPVPPGKHKLPPLGYSYQALEPYISREIMYLHHAKHHQSYVDGLNKAELALKNARETKNFALIKHYERELAFHGAGHYLHTIFWKNMSPHGKRYPTGELLQLIDQSFGSFSAFKEQFSEAAKNVEGAGWAILVWAPRANRLEILTAEKHQNLSQWDVIPLLVLDVWEHAYYLQYKNERPKYVDNWWNVVDWSDPESRFKQAKAVSWESY
ncbi:MULTISPECIES: superoxide dismutase [Bacillus]|uniref:superoxide dismutase n=2 Tax=Bacillus TaxID=1386 RepID=A0A0M4G842_9BACI|nr:MULTISPECIES: superoxide dismutase [Bacillus]ALC81303.1 superoxide dismutase [Bacillus gobiensis]MBP1080315.1 Fe-Mn family superoxide dismutase [Bacillus capparidis]MED1094178.1 superoxide dismutase [Bacillus capparidis]